MNSIAQYARAYADALDRLEMVQSYKKLGLKLTGDNIEVSWESGCGCIGYRELAEEVSKLVSAEMDALVQRAIANLDTAQDHARRDMEEAAHLGPQIHVLGVYEPKGDAP